MEIPIAWRGYRRRNWVAIVALILGLPVALLAALCLFWLTGVKSDLYLLGSACLWALIFGWSAIRLAR